MMLLGSKLALPWGHKLEHGNKENQLQNSSSLKLQGLELWYLVFSISFWTFINLIHMIPLESKLTPQWGHKLEHRNKEDQLQNSSSLKLEGIELRFLAPLAIGQQAYVMVRCPSCVHPSVRPSVRALTFSLNIFFAETTYRILMKFHRNVPTMVLFRISWNDLIPSKTLVAMATKLKIFQNLWKSSRQKP